MLVKEIKNNVESKDLEKLARSISDTLSGEFYTRVNVGIGTAVVGIKDLARSFKEAQIALEVGKVFDTDKVIVSYDNLGIARLSITFLPPSARHFYRKCSRRVLSSLSTTKHSSPFRSSLRTT